MIFHLTFFCSLVSILKVITAVNYNSTTVISTPINIIEAIYDARAANYDAGVVIQHCHFLPKLWYRSSNYGPSIIISGLASQFRVLYFYKNGPLVNRSNFFLPWLRAGLFLRRKVFRFPSIGRKTAVKVDESVFCVSWSIYGLSDLSSARSDLEKKMKKDDHNWAFELLRLWAFGLSG